MSLEKVVAHAEATEGLPRLFEPAAYSVDAFCRAHSISRSMFYALLRDGQGPRLMKIGARTLISREAAEDWRWARERATEVSPTENAVGGRRRRHHLRPDRADPVRTRRH